MGAHVLYAHHVTHCPFQSDVFDSSPMFRIPRTHVNSPISVSLVDSRVMFTLSSSQTKNLQIHQGISYSPMSLICAVFLDSRIVIDNSAFCSCSVFQLHPTQRRLWGMLPPDTLPVSLLRRPTNTHGIRGAFHGLIQCICIIHHSTMFTEEE